MHLANISSESFKFNRAGDFFFNVLYRLLESVWQRFVNCLRVRARTCVSVCA